MLVMMLGGLFIPMYIVGKNYKLRKQPPIGLLFQ